MGTTTVDGKAAGKGANSVLIRGDKDGVATLTINRPEARNAMSMELIDTMRREIDSIADDNSVRVVVLAAVGPAYCAGHDMREIRAHPNLEYYKTLFRSSSRLMQTIIQLPKPVIAQVHATATAAGLQLVGSCDMAIAGRSAAFATPGVQIGLFCSTPMVALSRNVSRKRAMEMLLTGESIDAETAADWGIVNRVVDDDKLDDAVAELAAKIVDKSPLAIAIGKEAFYRQAELDLAHAYDYASEVMARNMAAEDAEEGVDAFLEKRRPVWKGR